MNEKVYTGKSVNGSTIKYKKRGNLYFHVNTNEEVCFAITEALSYNERLRIHYGDAKTGRAWGDVETGYVGKSTGRIKIPLVIHNTRSMGGGGILDDCIIKIEYSNKESAPARRYGLVKYEHPNFQA